MKAGRKPAGQKDLARSGQATIQEQTVPSAVSQSMTPDSARARREDSDSPDADPIPPGRKPARTPQEDDRREPGGARRPFLWNLLGSRPAKAILRQPAFPLALQVAALAGIVAVTINGWGIGLTESTDDLMTLRKTNLTTLFVWGFWWPAMIAVALLAGRLWCSVCPMELVNRLADALARRIGWPRTKMTGWLKAGWLIMALYVVLQLLVAGFSIHRMPHYTSNLLIVLFGLALGAGLVFREPRSFCKGLCPAGALLSVYGRYTPLQLDIRDPGVCESCRSKDCVAQKNRYRFDKRSCPSLLQPFNRQQSDGCVLCFQCAKVCPYGNLGFGLVRREASSRRHRLLRPFEAAFVLIATGFVAHEVAAEVKGLDETFHAVPSALQGLAPLIDFAWWEAFWFLLLLPLALWILVAGASRLLARRTPWKTLLLAAATGAAPVVAVAHFAKAAAKVSAWLGFLPLVVTDPAGLETLQRLSTHTLQAPSPLVGLPLIGWIMLFWILLLSRQGWFWSRQAVPDSLTAARTGLVTVTVFFGTLLLSWPWS